MSEKNNLKEKELQDRIKQSYPFQPYDSQLQLSIDIYKSLVRGTKVSIFESPTGTGKSYALIEGALNYLEDQKNNQLIKFNDVVLDDNSLPDWFNGGSDQNNLILKKPLMMKNDEKPLPSKKIKLIEDEAIFDYTSDEEVNKKINIRGQSMHNKIIYCSRTHSQLKQFINEIRKSKHKVKLTTLGSRQHLCVNQSIISKAGQNANKLNHLCKINKKNCSYYKSLNTIEQYTEDIFDIQELMSTSKKCSSCPYYAAKELCTMSDLICIPYQLLMDSLDQFIEPIILIDEAHNFGSALLQSESSQISINQLNIVINGIEDYRKKYHQKVKAKTLYYLNQILLICKVLIEKIRTKPMGQPLSLIDFLVDIGIPKLDIIKLVKFIQNKEMKDRVNGFIDQTQNVQQFSSFQQICKFLLQLILSSQKESILYVEKQISIHLSKINNQQSFQALINKSKNLIFAGGTLKPLNEFELFKDMIDDTDFLFKEYPHIISQNRCQLIILDVEIEYSLKQKQDNITLLLKQTYDILHDIQKQVPEGIVVFLQTYSFLEQFQKFYKQQNLIQKPIFFDEKQNQKLLEQYSLKAQQGAILVSVIGGSLSEGINFSDYLARAVVIFGVPYPNLDSLELKEQINNNGNSYYENITMRAVNQSIGRVIRHKNDYGLLFLVDKRFDDEKLKSKFSSWLHNRITKQKNINVNNFFEQFKANDS